MGSTSRPLQSVPAGTGYVHRPAEGGRPFCVLKASIAGDLHNYRHVQVTILVWLWCCHAGAQYTGAVTAQAAMTLPLVDLEL